MTARYFMPGQMIIMRCVASVTTVIAANCAVNGDTGGSDGDITGSAMVRPGYIALQREA